MFLDLDPGQSFADSPGCRGQNIPQPGFPSLLSPLACDAVQNTFHQKGQNILRTFRMEWVLGSQVPHLSEPAWSTLPSGPEGGKNR